jgi:ABC-type bacteriocin/lantibiotic exporter with double-glycine peptidase domain
MPPASRGDVAFIETLPHGYDTLLGSAAWLSAGQRQQLAGNRRAFHRA